MPSIQTMLKAAIEHHKAGRFGEAEGLYRQILVEEPNQPDALNLLGTIAGAAGYFDAAIDLVGRAVAANPRVANFHGNLGETLSASGEIRSRDDVSSGSHSPRSKLESAWHSLGGLLFGDGAH